MGKMDKLKYIRSLHSLALNAIEGIEEAGLEDLKTIARSKAKWPVVCDLYSDRLERADTKLGQIDFGKDFPLENGKKSSDLRIWILDKLTIINSMRDPANVSKLGGNYDGEEFLRHWIINSPKPCGKNAREYAQMLRFWYLSDSEHIDLYIREFELKYCKEIDDTVDYEVDRDYDPLLKAQVLDKGRVLARRLIGKRLERAKNSLNEEKSNPGTDHEARVYDLKEKIKVEEAALKKVGSPIYQNM